MQNQTQNVRLLPRCNGCPANSRVVFFIYLKLELLTQLPSFNDEIYEIELQKYLITWSSWSTATCILFQ